MLGVRRHGNGVVGARVIVLMLLRYYIIIDSVMGPLERM
jgi:hypothetical protein